MIRSRYTLFGLSILMDFLDIKTIKKHVVIELAWQLLDIAFVQIIEDEQWFAVYLFVRFGARTCTKHRLKDWSNIYHLNFVFGGLKIHETTGAMSTLNAKFQVIEYYFNDDFD